MECTTEEGAEPTRAVLVRRRTSALSARPELGYNRAIIPPTVPGAPVSDTDPMADVVARLRRGDPEAAAALLRSYEPVIRSRIRVWLRMQDARLRRAFDSVDVCQSVMASFFVRASAGEYDLERTEQVIGLLVQMARHKLAHQVRREMAQRRDVRRTDGGGVDGIPAGSAEPTPSRHLAGKELLAEVRRRLTDAERRLADLRAEGHDWAAIAAEVGGTPDAVRVRLSRALDRVTAELGLDDPSDDPT
jgi:RNA polymerase sigma-70 factor (ECF subfamily)